jgi:hypothetical protein
MSRKILKDLGMTQEFDIWKDTALKRLKTPVVGDRVRVVRKLLPDDPLWNNTWILPEMDRAIGCTGKITSMGRAGVEIKFDRPHPDSIGTYCYPIFVLQRV